MSALSPDLMYFASRMSGFSTNTFKIETDNQSSATSASIVSFSLPSNSIINLRSFKIFARVNANKNTGAAGGRLPPIRDLIERIEVTMGGIVLSQGTNFVNVLSEAKKAVMGDKCDSVLGHPEYIRAKSYTNPALTYTSTDNENDPTTYHCIDEFDGFLGTADPMLFDSSIVPSLKVRCYMASDNVLSNVKGIILGTASGSFADSAGGAGGANGPPLSADPNTTLPKYELTDIHATIECVNLADMTYENMLASQMSAQGDLEVPYKAYYTFNDTHTGSSKFSVASSSLDRIWLAWRGGSYNSITNPITVSGHKIQGGFVQRSTALVNGALSASTALVIDNLVGDAPEVGDTVIGAGLTSGVTIVAVVSATAYTLSSAQSISDNILLTFERDAGVPTYDSGGVLNTNSEKYKGRYFNFSQPVGYGATTEWKAQLQLNGAYMPQFPANIEQLYGITRNSLEGGRYAKDITLDQYRKNFCVQAFRLNMPNSEYSRSLTGVDSRATNLAGIVRTDSAVGGSNLMIFCETTEILNISAGRSISVVV